MRFISTANVIAQLGLSKSTIRRLRVARRFVPAVRLSPGRIGFPADAVHQWAEQRIAESMHRPAPPTENS
jgi:predicted DNA-binding transcriptional regulator AlpA